MNSKRLALVAIAAAFAFSALSPAHAISHAFRAKLERSGCTQVTEADGTCDPNKTKAQNAAAARNRAAQVDTQPAPRSDKEMIADAVLGAHTDQAYAVLSMLGYENTAPLEWHKGRSTVLLTLKGDVVKHVAMP